MPKRVKIELDNSEIRKFLRSSNVYALCEKYTKKVRSKLPYHGYTSETYRNPGRASGVVIAKSNKARRDNMDNNTLLKALLQSRE